jgi:hypothetical protein
MRASKIGQVLKELKELKDASSKATVESAAKRVEETIHELELESIRSKTKRN